MLAFMMASMMIAASKPALVPAPSLRGQPTRFCREIGSAASRNQAVMVCRTKAQWQRAETCNGATRYCAPKVKVAMTAFPLNEDSRITCRIVKMTGSRLRSSSLCLANREWARMHDEAREEVGELQDNYSKQPNRDQ